MLKYISLFNFFGYEKKKSCCFFYFKKKSAMAIVEAVYCLFNIFHLSILLNGKKIGYLD